MARIETDPNYTTPTFSRATAGTDPFKKEDVQNLAAAFSTHVHDGSGKGLPVLSQITAAQIPTGLITSTMLADGTIQATDLADSSITSAKIADFGIQTIDLAPNSVQQLKGQFAAAVTFSTTTTGSWVDLPVSVSVTSAGNILRIEWKISVCQSVAGYSWLIALHDGSSMVEAGAQMTSAVVNGFETASSVFYHQPVAGSHTYNLKLFNYTPSTVTVNPNVTTNLYVTEQYR